MNFPVPHSCRRPLISLAIACLLSFAGGLAASESEWLSWRGPHQNGVSDETDLPGDTGQLLWSVDLSGRGTPVIRGERVYAFGYRGDGADLQEVLACYNAATGKTLWEHGFNDFLSDVIYERYSIGSPGIDGETGNVYVETAGGILAAFDADGKPVWSHSLMEELGRMTFPNGRNGAPVIHRNLVIVHCMTSNWGANGPVQDRFYAYDKRTGALAWSSSPGTRPRDNSFSTPVFATLGAREVFYAGTGCGNVVCVDANTGEPVWRFPLSQGGVNSSVLLYQADKLIAIHAKENLDSSGSGRLVMVNRFQTPAPQKEGAPLLEKSAEIWRNDDLAAWSSSPVVVGDRVYMTNETGDLCAVDLSNGKTLWSEKLGIEQLHSSVLYGDGKLYVPIKDGSFTIVKPSDAKPEILSRIQLDGECNGAPAACHGRVYVFSTKKLYCFGKVRLAPEPALEPAQPLATGDAVKFIPLPSEVLMRPGESMKIALTAVNASGLPVPLVGADKVTWAKFVPPNAKVRSFLNADFTDPATLVATAELKPSAGMFEGALGGIKGYLRGRILPDLPLKEDFAGFDIAVDHQTEKGVKFAYPPLPWIGARFKWEVRDVGGTKVLAKTTDNRLLQRALTFIGTPDMHAYTVEADVMSDGTKRKMSEVGVINQRYIIVLKGNSQELEVNSNLERVRQSVPFAWKPSEWYHLKTRVDVAADGSGMIRAKAWKRGDAEPAAWTIEVPHAHPHLSGSPGLFGFSPTDMRVYVGNILVTPNAK